MRNLTVEELSLVSGGATQSISASLSATGGSTSITTGAIAGSDVDISVRESLRKKQYVGNAASFGNGSASATVSDTNVSDILNNAFS